MNIDTTLLCAAVRLTPHIDEPGRELGPHKPSGSGFLVRDGSGSGSSLYLVTNRHVVDPRYAKGLRPGWRLTALEIRGYFQSPRALDADAEPQPVRLESPMHVFPSKFGVDLAVVPLNESAGMTILEGRGRFNALPVSMIAGHHDFSSDITIGRQVILSGYPGVEGQVAARPLMVGGLIATDPRYTAALGAEIREDEVFCHAFSWKGMSGCPVLVHLSRPTD
ncbi:trypsin-like peptidase domain-containing protein [Streptomyces sp. Tue6028]|uniref:trypsin-like peptidase domain-containing protein n=1 Tax=Streptomyces sp. Tue6028 TaxID=2036037 RepID=UPI003D71E050